MRFKDRYHAGLLLAEALRSRIRENALVLAVPRGGVPVADSLAKCLGLPLDVVLAKKIGHPFNKEYAVGALTSDEIILEETADVSDDYLQREIIRLRKQLLEKQKLLKGDLPSPSVNQKNIVLVDDGIATGYTLLATIKMLRKQRPASIIVAVPVAPISAVSKFRGVCDDFVCLYTPEDFSGVGEFYENFDQVTDEEVKRLLNASKD